MAGGRAVRLQRTTNRTQSACDGREREWLSESHCGCHSKCRVSCATYALFAGKHLSDTLENFAKSEYQLHSAHLSVRWQQVSSHWTDCCYNASTNLIIVRMWQEWQTVYVKTWSPFAFMIQTGHMLCELRTEAEEIVEYRASKFVDCKRRDVF